MATTDSSTDVVPAAVAPRRRLIALASVLAVVIFGGAGLAYWRWYNGATDLRSYAGIIESGPQTVGHAVYLNSDIQPGSPSSGHRGLDLRRVTPQITVNTAGARVQILTCRVADPNLGLGFDTDTSPCATVGVFHPGTIDLGFPATEIIYKITAAHPGTIRIEGADVSYSDGTRRGVQHAGSGAVIHVVSATK
jgi:hypothetical protein